MLLNNGVRPPFPGVFFGVPVIYYMSDDDKQETSRSSVSVVSSTVILTGLNALTAVTDASLLLFAGPQQPSQATAEVAAGDMISSYQAQVRFRCRMIVALSHSGGVLQVLMKNSGPFDAHNPKNPWLSSKHLFSA
jgi:hypothetical protein